MTLEEKILSMLMVHVPAWTRPGSNIRGGARPGRVILMGDNVPDPPDQLAA